MKGLRKIEYLASIHLHIIAPNLNSKVLLYDTLVVNTVCGNKNQGSVSFLRYDKVGENVQDCYFSKCREGMRRIIQDIF